MVSRRWTKEGPVTVELETRVDGKYVQLARYGELMSMCANICHISSHSEDGYDGVKEVLSRLTIESRNLPQPTNIDPKDVEYGIDSSTGLHRNVIRDPVPCRSKGTKRNSGSGKGSKKKKRPKCGIEGQGARWQGTMEESHRAQSSTFVWNGISDRVPPIPTRQPLSIKEKTISPADPECIPPWAFKNKANYFKANPLFPVPVIVDDYDGFVGGSSKPTTMPLLEIDQPTLIEKNEILVVPECGSTKRKRKPKKTMEEVEAIKSNIQIKNFYGGKDEVVDRGAAVGGDLLLFAVNHKGELNW
ncbi:hypothetical protein ACLB2K_051101 [Fragaria x ananassa]